MVLFPIRVEDSLDLSIERPHDADAREHGWPAQSRDQAQRFHGRLPLWDRVLGRGQLEKCLRPLE